MAGLVRGRRGHVDEEVQQRAQVRAGHVKVQGRATQGVRVMRVDDGEGALADRSGGPLPHPVEHEDGSAVERRRIEARAGVALVVLDETDTRRSLTE